MPAVLHAADAALPPLTPVRAATAPVIDGTLDDGVWQGPELPTGAWGSYNPLHGEAIPQQTHVWIAYDDRYMYIAFRCDDPEAAKIKTSITRRDNIWSDDWVGLSLDALGTGQVAYHMMVNPSGVQLDMLQTNSGGEDESPDWVWDSAGRVDSTGYTVEIRLPLQSIRFKGGDAARMGVLFWRRVSRTGYSVSWPQLKPNEWVFQHHAPLVFDQLRGRPTREAIPSVVYSGSEVRDTPSAWAAYDGDASFGLSGKYGVTSTITVDATVNPDFSQVESDAFQVEVNQRYPIFFSEKRPFFMEGAGTFTLAGVGGGDGNMISAVHTRRIVDPIVGGKVTGSLGSTTFGVLTAVDQAAGRDLEAGDPLDGHDKVFTIGRAQTTFFSPGSFAGAIVSTTVAGPGLEHRGRRRPQPEEARLVAADDRHGAVLVGHRRRRPPHARPGDVVDGRHELAALRPVRPGRALRPRLPDGLGVLQPHRLHQRVGLRRLQLLSLGEEPLRVRQARGAVRVLAGRPGSRPERIGQSRRPGHPHPHGPAGLLPRRLRRRTRAVGGQQYKRGRWRAFGNAQFFRWLRAGGNVNDGYATYYDEIDPFQGRSRNLSAFATIQPNSRLSEQIEWQYVDFDRADTGADVYDVTIINSRTTYQFTRQLYTRLIAQHDTSSQRLLLDSLVSYELRPGTVFFAGYGALRERRTFRDGEWQVDELSPLRESRRGLFLKASYLHRF